MRLLNLIFVAPLIVLAATSVNAHSEKKHTQDAAPIKQEQKDWGIGGDPKKVTRTIKVTMSDTMRFTPDMIAVKQGETVRITIKNQGKLLHEFVIGSKTELDQHAALMLKFPNMEHDEPYMAHVPAGGTESIIWTFNRAGNFDFACLIAGHYQAGMVGKISVAANTEKVTKEIKP